MVSFLTWVVVTAYLFHNYSSSRMYIFHRLFCITLTISIFKNANRTQETFHIREESRERREFCRLQRLRLRPRGTAWPAQSSGVPDKSSSNAGSTDLLVRRIYLLKPITQQKPEALRPRTNI